KELEYIKFIETLGNDICFDDDKWVCDIFIRAPSMKRNLVTLYFNGIPKEYKYMVKYFSAIALINGKAIATVKTYICDLIRFFKFMSIYENNHELTTCNEHTVTAFYQYLENGVLSESSKIGVWSSIKMFFKTMNGWNNEILRNPFENSPYIMQRKFDMKYIPPNVANRLDVIFKDENLPLHMRCAYWILRLIPSRVSEVTGIRIDCLKRYSENYVLFIPTWKQNGGHQEPILRSIHLEDTGISGYLIKLIKEQQKVAREIQHHFVDDQKGALLSYRQSFDKNGKIYKYGNSYYVVTKYYINAYFKKVCNEHKIVDSDGNPYKVTSHQFRHNGITDRLASGFTIAQIKEITDHHGDSMIYNSYNHLNLQPETIIKQQKYLHKEDVSTDKKYILFAGRILNMDEQLEKRLLKNPRAHKVRGGICSDITGCKSDILNCLSCKYFVPDKEQVEYYKEQIIAWKDKSLKFSSFPLIKNTADKNIKLYEEILESLDEVKLNAT
ncbi:MAG: tyrosine-type recombinase/integrase, partial [Eubacteriales bacterium]